MKMCDGCGKTNGAMISIGAAFLCRHCDIDVRPEIERLRAGGKPVNVLQIARKLFRETNSAGNYILRDIPDDLWKKAKHRATDDGDSLRDLILKSLHSYLGS